jgi:hypothetical protein
MTPLRLCDGVQVPVRMTGEGILLTPPDKGA